MLSLVKAPVKPLMQEEAPAKLAWGHANRARAKAIYPNASPLEQLRRDVQMAGKDERLPLRDFSPNIGTEVSTGI